MENKISVVINTYNAERHLREVLQSVSGFDETVVCDMESTDHTRDIARDFGCRIVTFPKADHKSAEPARTFAIQSASCPWVLVVDADELVTPQLHDYLYRRISEPDCPQGLFIPRQNRFMNIPQRHRIGDWQLRFFVRKGTTWPPYVHTFPTVEGRVERMPRVKGAMLVHLAENTIHEVADKANRYTDDEVAKRAGRRYGLWALLWRPSFRFFKAYVLKGKWREGLTGLIDSLMTGYYQFLLVSKIIEKRMTGGPKENQ